MYRSIMVLSVAPDYGATGGRPHERQSCFKSKYTSHFAHLVRGSIPLMITLALHTNSSENSFRMTFWSLLLSFTTASHHNVPYLAHAGVFRYAIIICMEQFDQ